MAKTHSKLSRIVSVPDRGRDVLFVYIGWSSTYDGEALVCGSHGWLNEHADDCSEMAAFKMEGGVYRCGIGSGHLASEAMDVVFVAKPPWMRHRRVVGLYLAAGSEPWNGGDTPNDWRGAFTRDAILFPEDSRFAVRNWPGSSGTRRWARRDGAAEHPALLVDYHRARRLARDVRRGVAPRETDEELSAFEGKLRTFFVKHRERERRLRDAKIQAALRAGKGSLPCEVPGCGFDFLEVYGDLGAGYAQVHHKSPLGAAPGRGRRTDLDDLAIVCANCHAMIHRGGECRDLRDVRLLRAGTLR